MEFALKYLQFMLPNIFKYLKLKNYELRILTYISSINTLLNTMHITKYLKFFKSIYSISYIRLGTRYIGLKKIRAIKRHTRKRLIKKSESIKFNN